MPRTNRKNSTARKPQTRKPDRATAVWLNALRSTPGFVVESPILPTGGDNR